MAVDGTRIDDLDRLQHVLDDPNESELHKRQATRAMGRIKLKMRDPVIKAQRERLVRAAQANDNDAMERIGEQLFEYEQRTFGRR
jgi:hypothetical protein